MTPPLMTGDGPADVLSFWLQSVGEPGWWRPDPGVDRVIAIRFASLVEEAGRGARDGWTASPFGALALLLLLDQFPRNLFRDDARAFQHDPKARAVADQAIARGFDRATAEPARIFFYLPFEHSEALADQDRSVALFAERAMSDPRYLQHAEAHRDLIRRFGRFPHRNACLGRIDTPEEQAHLAGDGYRPGAG